MPLETATAILESFSYWIAQQAIQHRADTVDIWGLIMAYCESAIFATLYDSEEERQDGSASTTQSNPLMYKLLPRDFQNTSSTGDRAS